MTCGVHKETKVYTSRPVCDPFEQETTVLCDTGLGTRSDGDRCFDHILGQDELLCLPTFSIDTTCPGQAQYIRRMHYYSHRPQLACSDVVPSRVESSDRLSEVDRLPGISTFPSHIQGSLPEPGCFQTSRLENIERSLSDRTVRVFPESVTKRIAKPQRHYDSKWSIFSNRSM